MRETIKSGDGFILTNAHIIEGTSRATVTLWDDSVYEALLVGYDSRNDLAVLKIEAQNLPVAEFCDSDAMEIGEENPSVKTVFKSFIEFIRMIFSLIGKLFRGEL